jgi:hypothetical protein
LELDEALSDLGREPGDGLLEERDVIRCTLGNNSMVCG